MDISAALAAHLAALSQALDTDDLDLESQLRAFTAAIKLAVTSYTGMTMTIPLAGHDLSFTVHDNPATADTREFDNLRQTEDSLDCYSAGSGFESLAAHIQPSKSRLSSAPEDRFIRADLDVRPRRWQTTINDAHPRQVAYPLNLLSAPTFPPVYEL